MSLRRTATFPEISPQVLIYKVAKSKNAHCAVMPKQRRTRKVVKRRVKKRRVPQRGGALRRARGPSLQDKIAYGASMFVDPTATFGSLAKTLEEQAAKGISDNVEHYLSYGGR